jgi:hypothetical protein
MEIITALYSFVSAVLLGALMAGEKMLRETSKINRDNQQTIIRIEKGIEEILAQLKSIR